MALIDTLKNLHPTLAPGVDYVLQDDGAGAYIKEWNAGVAEPTDAALTAATASAEIAVSKVIQIEVIERAYQEVIQRSVAYMGTTFQADSDSQDTLAKSLVAGAVPSGFFWLDAGNNLVAMTFAQLQGLAAAMLAQGQAAFAKKTVLKQQIRAAQTVSAVQAIVWG